MNVLYIVHRESDFGGAFLWNGLNHVLGCGNVYEYPEKMSYHGVVDRYNLAAEQGREGYEDGNTAPLPWMPARPSFTFGWDDAVVCARLRNGFFNLVVIESCRHTAVATFLRLAEDIRKADIPVVVHDGEDYSQLREDVLGLIHPDVYLKREMLKSEWSEPEGTIARPDPVGNWDWATLLLSFPFSCPDEIVPTEAEFLEARRNLEYDVCCLMGESWQGRADVLRQLEALPDSIRKKLGSSAPPERPLFESGASHPLLEFKEYIRTLRHSRCGVSVRGHGHDTCRYWETAANTLLIAEKPEIHIPNPYSPGVNTWAAGQGDSYETMIGLVKANAFCDDTEMAVACRAHTAAHHTNSARAKYLLAHLNL